MKKTTTSLVFLVLLSTTYADNVIYGTDNRLEALDAPKEYRPLVNATAAKVAIKELTLVAENEKTQAHYESGFKSLEKSILGRSPAPAVCASTKFTTQNTLAHCSGTLIGSKYILTARHCINAQSYWVFDYVRKKDAKTENYLGKADNVYTSVKTYLASQYKLIFNMATQRTQLTFPGSDTSEDFAIIELDRNVIGRTPVKISSKSLEVADEIFMLGFPAGIPMKYTEKGKILIKDKDHYFADSDSVAGNSGSGVYKKGTNEIIGVLIAGSTDYKIDVVKNCVTDNICESKNVRLNPKMPCSAEQIVRQESIATLYEQVLSGAVPESNILAY